MLPTLTKTMSSFQEVRLQVIMKAQQARVDKTLNESTDVNSSRKIPLTGPASDWTGKRTTFKDEDFIFIRERSPGGRERIIEHPAASNKYHNKYRFCHPNQPCGIMNATFGELKGALNSWEPYGSNDEEFNITNMNFDQDEAKNILQKSLLVGEDIRNMELIKASKEPSRPGRVWECFKVIIFDTVKQKFLLRTSFMNECVFRHYPKPLKNPSQHPEWCVDRSTLVTSGDFWSELKVLINSM